MEYTKGKWVFLRVPEEHQGAIIGIGIDDNHPIATVNRIHYPVESIANAKLIVSAVNACIEVNPENPLAVADGMAEVIRLSKRVLKLWYLYGVPLGFKDTLDTLDKALSAIQKEGE
jgi:Asp-tRNA(Asn)/Glu-tRNA(Gln) amidotransferase A subunit family amidase